MIGEPGRKGESSAQSCQVPKKAREMGRGRETGTKSTKDLRYCCNTPRGKSPKGKCSEEKPPRVRIGRKGGNVINETFIKPFPAGGSRIGSEALERVPWKAR